MFDWWKGMLSKEGDLEKFKNDPTPLMKYALGYEFDSSKTKLAQDVFENYFTNRSRFNPNTLEEVCTSIQFTSKDTNISYSI